MIKTTNPYTLTQKEYVEDSKSVVKSKIKQSQEFFLTYRKSVISHRLSALRNLKTDLKENKDSYAKLISQEMGKPVTQAKAEVVKCIACCDYYLKTSREYLRDEEIFTGKTKNLVSYQPLGPVLLIMPWNFPFWQVFRAAVPALIAGNTVLLKHASSVTGCSRKLEKIFSKSFGKYSFQSLIISGSKMDTIYENPYIHKVQFTGSTEIGAHVASKAAAHVKDSVLELGGNDAYLVLEDANIDLAIEELMKGRMMNNGQSCIAAKRWIIHQDIYNDFLTKAIEKLQSLKIGNPSQDSTDIGPLVDAGAVKKTKEQLKKIEEDGQKVHYSEAKLPSKGHFILPALVEVRKNKKDYNNEEIFAPIALLYKGKDEETMIDMANDSIYGLGSGVFTKSLSRGKRIAREELASGMSAVNQFVQSHPALPFGGYKKSGYGRELGPEGIRSFCNIKTVQLNS